MKKIIIMNDYGGPIMCLNYDDDEYSKLYDFIKKDKLCMELIDKIDTLYDSYYEFNSHEQPVWFNKEKEIEDSELMLNLVTKLIERISFLNDGSYLLIDKETVRLKELVKKKHKNKIS